MSNAFTPALLNCRKPFRFLLSMGNGIPAHADALLVLVHGIYSRLKAPLRIPAILAGAQLIRRRVILRRYFDLLDIELDDKDFKYSMLQHFDYQT